MRSKLLVFLGACFTLAGCEIQNQPEGSGDEGTDPGDGNGLEEIPVDTADTAEDVPDGTISGLVTVSLFTYDKAGELIWSDWESVYPDGDFPFGSIFVGAYSLDEETLALTFLDQYVIRSPDPEGNTYELQVDTELTDQVRVYAMLDYWGDGILATNEPMGIWPDTLALTPGEEVSGIDVDIPAPYYDFSQTGGGGTWDPDAWVELSGAGLITEEYAGGSCVAMIYSEDGSGPWYVDSFTPVKNDAGAEGAYSMWVPKFLGGVKLLGSWDSNYNGLIDPADTWGEYVDDAGAAANPILVADKDLPDHTLMLPSGTNVNPSLVPFVVISGDVLLDAGFDSLDPSAEVIVTAMKYKPDSDISAADIPSLSYDFQTFTAGDLTGSALPYVLVAPANTIVYLWAYADVDGDGKINETGESVASYGNDPSGHVATGTSSHPDVDLTLNVVEK